MKFASIIITHWAMNDERSTVMIKSLTSLVQTIKYPYELIVVDNGGSEEDSHFLTEMTNKGHISTYIKNSNNRHFGYARNQGIAMAQGDYIAIIDNDILHKKDWLTRCVEILEKFPEEKIYATPIDYPQDALYDGKVRYRVEEREIDGEKCSLNMRAGSNCFVIRYKDLMDIGKFAIHRIAGTKWTDNAVKKKYNALVLSKGYVEDMGFRNGYHLKDFKPVYIEFNNKDRVYFNVDEYENINMRRFR
jgi:glycosyltransferase involved in cell wall biosynthesis